MSPLGRTLWTCELAVHCRWFRSNNPRCQAASSFQQICHYHSVYQPYISPSPFSLPQLNNRLASRPSMATDLHLPPTTTSPSSHARPNLRSFFVSLRTNTRSHVPCRTETSLIPSTRWQSLDNPQLMTPFNSRSSAGTRRQKYPSLAP